MNESQEAFEAAYPHYDHRLGVDGKYHSRVSQDAYTYFTKGVAYGRKAALEEVITINHNLAANSEGVNQIIFAYVLNRKLLELIK
jgi:hypothetical protein